MKKRFLPIIVFVLLLTSCANGNASAGGALVTSSSAISSDSNDSSPFQNIPLKDYSAVELAQISLNSSSTVPDNSINMKSDHPGRILWVEQTSTLFYVCDDKTYQQNDSGTIAIADFPMLSMSLYNGNLYFVYPLYRDIKYDPTKRWGIVCAMDLSNGEITQVSEEDNVVNAYVVGGKLYFTLMEKTINSDNEEATIPTKSYEMDMSTGQKELIVQDTQGSPFAVSEKYSVFTDYTYDSTSDISDKTVISIANKKTGETASYTEDKWLDNLSVLGDKLYYVYGAHLRVLDLSDLNSITAETYEIYDQAFHNLSYIWTYTIFNGKLAVSTGTDISIWNGEDFEQNIPYTSNMNKLAALFSDIYSDGRQIYALNGGTKWYAVGTDSMNDLVLPSGEIVSNTLTLTELKGE